MGRGLVPAVVTLLAGAWLGPNGLVAQADAGRSAWRGSVSLIAGPGLAREIYRPECSDGPALGAALAIWHRVGSEVTINGDIPVVVEAGVGNCSAIRPPPPPPYTESRTEGIGQPLFAPSLRVSVGPSWPNQRARPKVETGAGILTQGPTPFVVAGLGMEFGPPDGRIVVVGVEAWFATVPVRAVLRQMEGGVELQRSVTESNEATRMVFVRLSIVH